MQRHVGPLIWGLHYQKILIKNYWRYTRQLVAMIYNVDLSDNGIMTGYRWAIMNGIHRAIWLYLTQFI